MILRMHAHIIHACMHACLPTYVTHPCIYECAHACMHTFVICPLRLIIPPLSRGVTLQPPPGYRAEQRSRASLRPSRLPDSAILCASAIRRLGSLPRDSARDRAEAGARPVPLPMPAMQNGGAVCGTEIRRPGPAAGTAHSLNPNPDTGPRCDTPGQACRTARFQRVPLRVSRSRPCASRQAPAPSAAGAGRGPTAAAASRRPPTPGAALLGPLRRVAWPAQTPRRARHSRAAPRGRRSSPQPESEPARPARAARGAQNWTLGGRGGVTAACPSRVRHPRRPEVPGYRPPRSAARPRPGLPIEAAPAGSLGRPSPWGTLFQSGARTPWLAASASGRADAPAARRPEAKGVPGWARAAVRLRAHASPRNGRAICRRG